MNELDRYLFDLHGYIVVKGALNPDQVGVLNDAMDRHGVPELLERTGHIHTGFPDGPPGNQDPDFGPIDVPTGSLLDWGPELRDMVDLPTIRPYLEALLQPGYRLDHSYAILMRKGWREDVGHALHNGNTPYDPAQSYIVRDGKIFNGLIVVSYALTTAEPGAGGFCIIPGSHKSGFPLPKAVRDAHYEWPVQQVPLEAGDAVIFTEATTHGAMPWFGQNDRRALLFKYCPGYMQWEEKSPWVAVDDRFTDQQRSILRSPFAGGRV
jgi:hypothetical protein